MRTMMKIYVDGALAGSTPATGLIDENNVPVTIGAVDQNGGMIQFFKGLIDEVSIYDRALSASEIQTIFDTGSAGKCKDIPVITTESLADGIVDKPYSQTLAAVFGTQP